MIPTVRFKSIPKNWEKEVTPIKPNTLRKKDINDKRHHILVNCMISGEYGLIEMENTDTNKVFSRQITDVTEWGEYLIISWRHE